MVDYEDLGEVQKKALVDAFGEPSDYEVPSLREVDVTEAASYDSLRGEFEGLEVERGSMESERLNSWLERGILRQDDEGNYEVNSVWRPQQVEEMQENKMVDLSSINFYSSDTPEATEISVLSSDDGFKLDIEDGGLTYNLPEADSVDSAEYESAEKIQEVTEDFIEFFACEDDEKPDNTGFMNTSSKPDKSFPDEQGGEIMEDYEEVEEELEQLKDVAGQFYDLVEDSADNAAVAEDIVDQAEAVQGMVGSALSSYRQAQIEYNQAAEQIDEMDEIIEGVYRTIDVATDKLSSIYEDLDENITEAGDRLDNAYSSLESLADRGTPSFTPDSRVREVAEKVEGTDPERFDEIAEDFENIGSSE